MPFAQLGGTRLSLSYTVFFAAAIFMAVVLAVSRRPGNDDLLRVAALGTTFWISGWLVQAITQLGLARMLGLPLGEMSIGLIGVEARPRLWLASRSLLVAVATVTSLIALGSFYRLVEGGFQLPTLSRAPSDVWVAPSIGFATYDSIWKSAAWLCWVQAVFQMYPLPRTMGRQIFAALSRLCGGRLDLATQTLIFRRCLIIVAFLTLAMAALLISGAGESLGAKWPFLLLLGLILWASSLAVDVTEVMAGFHSAEQGELLGLGGAEGQDESRGSDRRPGIIKSAVRAIRTRRERRRVRQTLQRERSEAVDAQRLDEILQQLHRDGIDSLSQDDRRILDRVSENLRKRRQFESQQSSPPEPHDGERWD